jgi:hygromycin-B 7''-O-kinase
VRVPRLLASGQLLAGPDPWPFLVTTRMGGTPWREAALSPLERVNVAGQLGELMRTVHDAPVPEDAAFRTSRMTERGTDPAAWHRTVLPRRLAEQIDGYVIRDWPDRRLVHADLTEDHVFVTDRGDLAGVIDWGDAQATDPHYELGPLQVLTFRCERSLLRTFLDGYGWDRAEDFAQRALSASLLHRKSNLFSALDALRPLDTFTSLDELADYLWSVP